MFVTFDGPNGVGKTTIINKLNKKLEKLGYNTYMTKEPTDSSIGNFIKQSEEMYTGYVLANLVAADRHSHIQNEILPRLRDGNIVLCDRYIVSSLILQRLDGLSVREILDINTGIIKPDLTILLIAELETINQRLRGRQLLTRFEREFDSSKELYYTKDAANYLYNDNYIFINTENDIDRNLEIIFEAIHGLQVDKQTEEE